MSILLTQFTSYINQGYIIDPNRIDSHMDHTQLNHWHPIISLAKIYDIRKRSHKVMKQSGKITHSWHSMYHNYHNLHKLILHPHRISALHRWFLIKASYAVLYGSYGNIKLFLSVLFFFFSASLVFRVWIDLLFELTKQNTAARSTSNTKMTKLTATLQSTSDPHLFIKNKIPDKHLKDAISTLASKKRTNSDRTSKSVNSSGNRFLVRAMKI